MIIANIVFIIAIVVFVSLFIVVTFDLISDDWNTMDENTKKTINMSHKKIYDSYWKSSHTQIVHDNGFFVNVYCRDMAFIDFETFRKFYEINPDAWSLFKFSVCKDNSSDMCYTFTYKEWEKYGYWREELKRKQKAEEEEQARVEKEQKDYASLQKLLDSVQKDIDAMNERAKAEINSAKEITKQVMNTI